MAYNKENTHNTLVFLGRIGSQGMDYF